MRNYFMYGISVSYDRYREWEDSTGRKIPVGTYGDIFCLFNGRDGKCVIIGKKIRVSNEERAILVPELTVNEETKIEIDVATTFGFKGEFHYYYVIE